MANEVENLLAELNKTNEQNQEMTSALKKSIETINALQQKLTEMESKQSTDDCKSQQKPWSIRSRNGLPGGERSKYHHLGCKVYYWSCGYDVGPNNYLCRYKKPGHQVDATQDKIERGSKRHLFHYTQDGK